MREPQEDDIEITLQVSKRNFDKLTNGGVSGVELRKDKRHGTEIYHLWISINPDNVDMPNVILNTQPKRKTRNG